MSKLCSDTGKEVNAKRQEAAGKDERQCSYDQARDQARQEDETGQLQRSELPLKCSVSAGTNRPTIIASTQQGLTVIHVLCRGGCRLSEADMGRWREQIVSNVIGTEE